MDTTTSSFTIRFGHHDDILQESREGFDYTFRRVSLEVLSMPSIEQIALNKFVEYPIDKQPNETYKYKRSLYIEDSHAISTRNECACNFQFQFIIPFTEIRIISKTLSNIDIDIGIDSLILNSKNIIDRMF